MLIDSSYFTTGARRILNATAGDSPNPNSADVNSSIESFVCELQEEFLRLALGSTLGNRINAYLVAQDEDGISRPVKSYEPVLQRLRSPFADYVFYHILRVSNDQPTVTGLVRLKCANEYVSPKRRQVDAWNRMVSFMSEFLAWCKCGECEVEGISVDDELLTPINILNL